MLRRVLFALVLIALSLLMLCANCETDEFRIMYPRTETGEATEIDVYFDEGWFAMPSFEYNHDIAKLSISMAMAAFRNNHYEDEASDVYIRTFFDKLGFEGQEYYGYDLEPSDDTVSSALAYKRVGNGAESFVLVLSPVCGQGYGNEWLSNFTIDDGVNHAGFQSAAEKVFCRIEDYVSSRFPGERVKVLITGFSRAAAVSNLTGAMLLTNSSFLPDDVYVYSFGTPNTTKQPQCLPQIHNICGSFDPVTRVPFTDWGYKKNGITHYLPSIETDPDYHDKVVFARNISESYFGNGDAFGSVPERNWLISKILNLSCLFIPESSEYSEVFQNALKAAWTTDGNALQKLENLVAVVTASGGVGSGYDRVKGELLELISLGITDTVKVTTNNGGSLMWYELLSSGMNLASEHFPEVYYSWIYAFDDGNRLFINDERYRKLIISGETSIEVYKELAASPDGLKRESEVAIISIPKQNYIYLPGSSRYYVYLTANDGSEIQIGVSNPVMGGSVVNTLYTTNEITLYDEDCVSIFYESSADLPEITINFTDMLVWGNGGDDGTTAELLMAGTLNANKLLMNQLAGGVMISLYILLGVLLIVYVLIVVLKRLIRGPVRDDAYCRPFGRIALVGTAVLAVCVACSFAYQLFVLVSHAENTVIPYRTMQRASEYLGIGNVAYLCTGFSLYALLAVESVLSIGKQLSRIRLVRIAIALTFMNILTAILSKELHTIAAVEIMSYVVPILAMLSLKFARKKGADSDLVGIVWLPLSRTIIWTAILFVIRQAALWLWTVEAMQVVVMKFMTFIPVVILAIRMYVRRPCRLMRMNLLGVIWYMFANTAINLNVVAGVTMFAVGHLCMSYGYAGVRRITLLKVGIWVLLTAVFGYEIIRYRSVLPESLLPFALIYDAVMCAMIVLAFPLSAHYRFGTLLYLIANQLLLLVYIYPESFTIGSVELLTFYGAVILMTTDPHAMRSHGKEPIKWSIREGRPV